MGSADRDPTPASGYPVRVIPAPSTGSDDGGVTHPGREAVADDQPAEPATHPGRHDATYHLPAPVAEDPGDDETGTFLAPPPPPAAPDEEGTKSFVAPADPYDPAAAVPLGETKSYDYGPNFSPKAKRRKPGPAASAPAGYELLGELGRGGMGVVYKARQVGLNRTAALKMILAGAHAGAQQLARFRTEAEASARLTHPNIVQVYEFGEHDGLPYFALEFVDGGTLSKQTKKEPQPPRRAAEVVATLARAIQYAHDHGVIHRDLKPANVLVGSDGTLKIADFGLAKKLEEEDGQTVSGSIVGTPQYMAPEQARGDTKYAGPAADQYSLGAVLYDLLVGRPPIVGASVMETITLVQTQEPVPVRDLLPKVPIDLETICLKCLQKEPEKRYPSCAALADDLHRFLDGRPIVARPVGPAERLWRWAKRNPTVARLAAGVAGLALFITVGSAVAAVQFNALKEVAEGNETLARANEKKATDNAALAARNEETAKANEQRATENAALAHQNEEAANANAVLAAQNEKKAEKNAEAARAGEDQALTLARTTVETLLAVATDAQNELKRRPGTRDVRLALMDLVDRRLDDLSRTIDPNKFEGATATKFKRTQAAVHQRRADYQLTLVPPRTAKAAELYGKAFDITTRLAAGEPTSPVHQFNLGGLLAKRGRLAVMVGDVAGARRDLSESLAKREALAKVDPKARQAAGVTADIQQLIVMTREQLGRVHLLMGDPAAARAEYDAALKLREAGGAKGPPPAPKAPPPTAASEDVKKYNDADLRHSDLARQWAGVYDGLGEAAARLGDVPAARRLYAQALTIRQGRAGVARPRLDDRRDVAISLDRLGDLALLHDTDAPAAVKRHAEGLDIRRKLLALDEDDGTAVRDVADSLYRVGTAKLKAGDAAGARAAYQECRDLRQKLADDPTRPNDQGLLIELMLARARCGEHAEAAKLAKLVGGVDNPGWLFFTGCGLALSAGAADATPAERAAYTRDALAALNSAVDKGWKDRTGLERDPDLEPIRGDAGFKTLLDRVPAPGKK